MEPLPITPETLEELEMIRFDYDEDYLKLWDILSEEEIKYFANYLTRINVEEHFITGEGQGMTFRSPHLQFPVEVYKKDMPEFLKSCGEGAEMRCRIFTKQFQSSDLEEVRESLIYLETPFVPQYVLKKIESMTKWSDEDVWTLIIDAWILQEFPHTCHELWSQIFSVRPRSQSFVQDLPETFTVYRGGHPDGYSWSLSQDQARWFYERSKRFGLKHNRKLKRTVRREDVLFYNNDREEQEVVILPKVKLRSGGAK